MNVPVAARLGFVVRFHAYRVPTYAPGHVDSEQLESEYKRKMPSHRICIDPN